eukprot:SAG22_NODE_84_length_21617_cov_48.600102_9_plen_127_part_00
MLDLRCVKPELCYTKEDLRRKENAAAADEGGGGGGGKEQRSTWCCCCCVPQAPFYFLIRLIFDLLFMFPSGSPDSVDPEAEIGGKVELEIEILHEQAADRRKAGPGREEPNANPKLDTPIRFNFSL